MFIAPIAHSSHDDYKLQFPIEICESVPVSCWSHQEDSLVLFDTYTYNLPIIEPIQGEIG